MLGSSLKHLPHTRTRLGRTLDIALRLDLLRNGETLGARDGALVHPAEILDRLGVVSEVDLARDENDGEALAKVEDFRDPLLGCQRLILLLCPAWEGLLCGWQLGQGVFRNRG